MQSTIETNQQVVDRSQRMLGIHTESLFAAYELDSGLINLEHLDETIRRLLMISHRIKEKKWPIKALTGVMGRAHA